MPIIKSAKKRVKTTKKATVLNARTKKSLRNALKAFTKAANSINQSAAQSALDKAGKKGLLHKNKIARKKRQLAVAAKKAGTKVEKRSPVVSKATTGKAVKTTKTVTKKAAPAKKVVKKAVAKKPTAKKAPAKK
ncbi:hypothetical protein BH10PAT3_BH10PAT3_5920 [soil metagenome]